MQHHHEAGHAGGNLPDEMVAAVTGLFGPVGALAGPLARRMSTKLREEHGRRQSVALAAAERLAGCSREQLAEAIETRPEFVPLLTRLLYAAGTTGCEECLRVMGMALGAAATGATPVDQASSVIRGLTDLDPMHVQVLEALADPRLGGLDHARQIAARLGITEEFAMLHTAVLVGRGLVAETSLYDGTGRRPSPIGHEVLKLLHELRTELDDQSGG